MQGPSLTVISVISGIRLLVACILIVAQVCVESESNLFYDTLPLLYKEVGTYTHKHTSSIIVNCNIYIHVCLSLQLS